MPNCGESWLKSNGLPRYDWTDHGATLRRHGPPPPRHRRPRTNLPLAEVPAALPYRSGEDSSPSDPDWPSLISAALCALRAAPPLRATRPELTPPPALTAITARW